jgi:hypothetical protein
LCKDGKKLVLQVSNKGIRGEKNAGQRVHCCDLRGALLICKKKNTGNMCPVNNKKLCVQVKINHAEDQ